MMRIFRTAALLVAALSWVGGSLQAQTPQRLPLVSEMVQVNPPEGFRHGFESGQFTTFLREYIPAGETVQQWSRLLSVPSFADPRARRPADEFWALLSGGLARSCEPFTVQPEAAPGGEVWHRTDCTARPGVTLPGASSETRRELGLYRIVVTGQALYAIHFSWHGADTARATTAQREAFYAAARAAVAGVVICDMVDDKPCTGVDLYAVDGQEAPFDGPPPCARPSSVPCSPIAFLELVPPGADETAPLESLTIRYREQDPRASDLATRILGATLQALQAGRRVRVVGVGPAPTEPATTADRQNLAALFTLVRSFAMQRQAADPDSASVTLYNFR